MAALARLGIEGLAPADSTRLSGGQRQLVLIARALAQEAGFLVLDEPTASLDFGNQARVLSEIRKLRAAGLGIILSTHAPDHAFACADRVLLFRDGRLLGDGPPAGLLTPLRLREVYGITVEIVPVPALGHPVCVPHLEG
jgi:iron complex transport system ATP-binding protein